MAETPPQIDETRLSRRHMLMGAALCGVSALAFSRTPKPDTRPLGRGALEAMIPAAIGPWSFLTTSGLVVPPADALSDQLYDEVLTRVYVRENMPPVMFLIAYSSTQTGLLQVHRPEVCYPAGGFALSETRIERLAVGSDRTLPVRRFSAESATRSEHVMYWTRIGTALPTSWWDQRVAVVRANLDGIIPDGILVRVSAVSPDVGDIVPYLEQFIRALCAGLDPKARQLLFGA